MLHNQLTDRDNQPQESRTHKQWKGQCHEKRSLSMVMGEIESPLMRAACIKTSPYLEAIRNESKKKTRIMSNKVIRIKSMFKKQNSCEKVRKSYNFDFALKRKGFL